MHAGSLWGVGTEADLVTRGDRGLQKTRQHPKMLEF